MRTLIVAPRFHGYGASVARALERSGHEAVLHSYDRPATTAARVRNKAVHDLPPALVPAPWRGEPSRRAVERLHAVRPARVLVIKGDLLDERWWEAVHSCGASVLTWLYDEVARMDYSWQRLETMPVIASYSAGDVETMRARGLNAHHLPNAFDSLLGFAVRPEPAVSFIGARYDQRVRLLVEAHRLGVPLRVYGRDWSRRPRDVAATRMLPVRGLPTGPQLERADGYGVMAGSLASLNTHSRQDGFTMRTFEIPGAGGIQLVDRRDVAEFYEPDREVLVFDDAAHLKEQVDRIRRDRAWARSLRERGRRRTLAEHTFVRRAEQMEQLWG
ncbi:glycosyltransferase [Kocuria palustris]|uniref:glycosyltransferase family protein n=1 Tax=Kocuria palustris TaxID=71999 RepID=UPI0011AA97AE|nr:glycosyltransferase [Kocuria palustris]